PSRRNCYGWELIALIRLLHDRLPVRGVLIGDGTGLGVLKQRCAEYGIEQLVEFAGRIPFRDLPARLQGIDICLSTQTNDEIGRVRTTGKLPLYLAAGRFVLASKVGEAARILPPQMLVEFTGSADPEYPQKVAARVLELMSDRTRLAAPSISVGLARAHFD